MSCHSGAMPTGPRKARPDDRLRIEPGISRFRAWSFGPSRNDGDRISSALLRRDIPKLRRVLANIVETVGQMYPLVRWRALLDRQSRPPFLRRADRPRDKTAAAVRAHIVQPVLDAVRAERAFVTADSRFRCMRRKILVTIFAVWPELQRHGGLVMPGRCGSSQISCQTQMPNLPRFRPSPANFIAATPSTAAFAFPSTDRARSTSAHALRSGAASARC